MKPTLILTFAAAIALGGIGTYAATRPADAQDAAVAPMTDGGPDQGHHHWGIDGRDGGERHGPWSGPGGWHRHRMMVQRSFGLFFPVADKNLSTADVQTIAQAMLLRHGNHAWKVTDVVQNQDNTVSFAFATADGGVVARFAINTQTGQRKRIG